MESILLQIPPEIASQIKLPPRRAKELLMKEFVLRLYEEGIITTGHGAQLLKMGRLAFEQFLARHHTAIHGNADEIIDDMANIDQAL